MSHDVRDPAPGSKRRRPWPGRCVLVALALVSIAGWARAELMLFPTRVVFDGNTRAMQVELINNGKESATYRISLVNRRMGEDGEFLAAQPALPDERFADDLVRYSPRQVVLAPGMGQTIRMAVRKPADLADGEYRSHLRFDRVPGPAGGTTTAAATAGTPADAVGIELTMLVGVSIPVIVRHGHTSATLAMRGLELVGAGPGRARVLALELHRSGNASAYGDLAATFTPAGGAALEIGQASGVAVYAPNALRRIRLELKPPPGLLLARGTLRIGYRERPEAGGKLLAEAAIEVP